VERQLRSWTPRGPSPKLKARLFAPSLQPSASASVAVDGSNEHPGNGTTWHWLSPAMAVFFLGVFLYGNEAGLLHQFHASPAPSLTSTAAAAVLSQPEYATYYASVRHSENNALRNTFEWTNGSSSLTTAPPMAPTNSVIQ